MSETVRPLIAGNWKMNGARAMTRALIAGLADCLERDGDTGCEVLVCPPSPYLLDAAGALSGVGAIGPGAIRPGAIRPGAIRLGAQDCHPAGAGAHTGDVAAAMLRDVGCAYAIVGHSERRADHGEGDALVKAKAEAAIAAGLAAIVCIGETLAERDAGRAAAIVTGQLEASLPDGAAAANTVIAYEPVWAIGTGRIPTEGDIADIHARIREVLGRRLSDGAGVRILYGGSVKPDNAAAILAIAEVNGALVGGASLDAGDFWSICRSCL